MWIALNISLQNKGCKGNSENAVIEPVLIALFYVCYR